MVCNCADHDSIMQGLDYVDQKHDLGTTGAFTDGAMLILYGIRSILIRIKAISRVGDPAHT